MLLFVDFAGLRCWVLTVLQLEWRNERAKYVDRCKRLVDKANRYFVCAFAHFPLLTFLAETDPPP